MKILIICYEYPPIGGGGGIAVKNYAEEWAKKNKVIVLTSNYKNLKKKEVLNGVEINRIPALGKKDRATATLVSMLSYIVFGSFYFIKNIKKLKKINIVNTHFSIPSGPLGIIIAKLLGKPDVLTIIGGDIYDPTKKFSPHRNIVMRTINKLIINSATKIVSISNDTKKRAQKYYKIKKEIKVINCGFVPVKIPNIKRGRLNLSETKYYLISIGRLIPRKGFKYLIVSLNYLPNNINLIIIGDGPLKSRLKNYVKKRRGLKKRVIFTGFLDSESKYSYLKNADCYVLPSLHEGLGIVLQEAMYTGLPIVATNNGGQNDLIKETRNGFLVPPKQPKILARAIKKIYSNPKIATEMKNNNLKDIKKLYISSNSKIYLNMFERLIQKNG